MQVRLFKKRILYVVIIAIVLYLIIHPRERQYKATFVINDSNALEVWEFVADFSNMKKLIPNMLEFNILSESGNYDHWHYSAHYTEFLQQLPFLHYFNYGHFDVKPEEGSFVIRSNHSTCFFTDITCVRSRAEFWFTQQDINTLCVENVIYNCPLIFSALCLKEVSSQRRMIAQNLKKQFLKPSVLTSNI